MQPQAGPFFFCPFAPNGEDQHFDSLVMYAAQAMWSPQECWWPQAVQGGRHGRARAADGRHGRPGASGAAVTGASREWHAPASLGQWFDALLAGTLDEDPEMQGQVLAAIRGQALHCAFDKKGCRLVQWALGSACREVHDALLAELSGHMLDMMGSPYANYVAQKVCAVMPAARMGAVIKEFEGEVERVARHRYGCRILIELLAHCLDRPECAALVDELLSKANGMLCHQFAHHTIEAVLEHGNAHLRHRVARALSENLLSIAQNRHGSFLVLAALIHCSDADARWLCGELNGGIMEVTAKKPGCKLYHELCTGTPPRTSEAAVAALMLHAPLLRQRPEGRRLVAGVLGGPTAGAEASSVPEALEEAASTQPSGLPLTVLPRRMAWADEEDDFDEDLAAVQRPEEPQQPLLEAQRWQ